MQIRIRNELIPLNLLVFVLIIAIIFFPSNVLRVVLGLPFVLFFPGYALMAALFPRRERMEPLERIALSFGMSIAIVPFIGMILNFTHWGIRLEPFLCSVTSFILATSVIAWLRRRMFFEQGRFGIEFQLKLPGWGRSARDRALLVVLVIAILAAFGVMGYVMATPKVEERFTEFYIIGPAGKATNYPTEVTLGESGSVIVTIVNREHKVVSYRVEVRIDGVKTDEIEPVTLEHDGRWDRIVTYTPVSAGDNQRLEILLYSNGETEPYLEPLQLWIDVAPEEHA